MRRIIRRFLASLPQYMTEKPKHERGTIVLPMHKVYRQLNDYACGATAVMTVAQYFYPMLCMSTVYLRVNSDPDEGTGTNRMIRALRKYGVHVRNYRSKMTFDDISQAIRQQRPVIVCIGEEADGDDSHWCVLYGVREIPQAVLLAGLIAPPWRRSCREMRFSEFEKVWFTPGSGFVCSKQGEGVVP